MWIRKIEQQADLDDRQQRVAFERVGVVVEDVGSEEDQQVAGDVDDEIENEREAGDADQDLRADGRTEDA